MGLLQAVINRSRGMFVASEATLAEHGRPAPPTGVVMREHVLPLLALTSLVGFLLLVVVAPVLGGPAYPAGDVALTMIVRIVLNVIGIWITAAVIRFHAARMGGDASMEAAFVLAALALTPTFVVEMVAPMIELAERSLGLLAVMASGVYAAVLIYRGGGVILGLPDAARARHAIATAGTLILIALIASFVMAMLVLGAI